MSKSASLKILGLKLVKLDCIIIQFNLVTFKKARNKLDGARGLPLVVYNHGFALIYFLSSLILQIQAKIQTRFELSCSRFIMNNKF